MHGCSTLHSHAHLFNTSTVTRQGLLRAGERPDELLACLPGCEFGLKPVINCIGNFTSLGGSRMHPDAVAAVEEARVDQELKAAKELGSSLAVYISQLQQERAQEQESLRQARRIR